MPAFIVADLPPDIAHWVHTTRLTFEPAIASLPAEITLAGSSGLGPLIVGQDIEWIRTRLESALAGRIPFQARFTGTGNFPGTDIFFAEPEQEPFVALHRAIASSGIAFAPNQFPYRAHCSLKGLTPLRRGDREALTSLVVPSQPFPVLTVSVYQMERMQATRLVSIQA